MLRLVLRHLPQPDCTPRQAILFSFALLAAAYLSAASLYGLLLLPLISVAQGMTIGLAVEGLVHAAAVGEALAVQFPVFLLLQLPVLFFLTQRGLENAVCLAEHKLSLRGATLTKEFFLLTGLLLVSASAAIICCRS